MIVPIRFREIKYGGLILMLAVVTSCSSDELGPNRDVAYFMKNDEDRKAVIEKCGNDPGKYRLHPNCENAYKARTRLMLTSGNNTGIRPPPPGYFSWSQEKIDQFSKLTPEEKEKYYESEN